MKKTTLVLAVVASAIGLGYVAYKNMPKTTVQAARSSEFVLDKPYKEVRKSIIKGRFEKEILLANNATLVEKQWIDKGFHIEKPLSKNRHWEFKGRLLAKVRVDHPKAGQMTVEMIEDIYVATDGIEIHSNLNKPLSVGVTDMRQDIVITPSGETKTSVKIAITIKVQRFIPSPLKDYAQKQVNEAADESVRKLETIIRSLGQ